MIRFSLVCDNAHDFEGWFGSNADFAAQQERRLVTCPVCGSHAVEKSLMAPAVNAARDSQDTERSLPTRPLAMDPGRAEMMAALREMVRSVKASAEDVGERFAEEARRIHYGESEERGIRGKASLDDARALLEEGIGIAPLPDLPEDLS